jgi:AraC-like DNA-binding protein
MEVGARIRSDHILRSSRLRFAVREVIQQILLEQIAPNCYQDLSSFPLPGGTQSIITNLALNVWGQYRGIMTRAQLRRLFRKHHGECARLARELELSPVTISRWFRGLFDSARIQAAVFNRAKELLQRDAQDEAAEERMRQELANAGSSAESR